MLEPLDGGAHAGQTHDGLRVLTPEGVVPSTGALVTRNVFRIIDSMPVFYVVGLLFVMFGRRHLRLGDLAAGTVLAVERAPFLEKLDAHGDERVARHVLNDAHAPLHAVATRRQPRPAQRQRRARRAGVVDDYRRAAHELGTARGATTDEYLEAIYADLHDSIHRPARRASGGCCGRCCAIRCPRRCGAMRVHLLAVTLLFVARR